MHTLCIKYVQTLCTLKNASYKSVHPVCISTLRAYIVQTICKLYANPWVHFNPVSGRRYFRDIELSYTTIATRFLAWISRQKIWFWVQAHYVHCAHFILVHTHFIWAHAHFVQTLQIPPSRPSLTYSLRITLSLNGLIPPTTFVWARWTTKPESSAACLGTPGAAAPRVAPPPPLPGRNPGAPSTASCCRREQRHGERGRFASFSSEESQA